MLLWERLQSYDSDLPLLQLIKYDCEREWHNYVRLNCGNITPDNANHYSNIRKVTRLFYEKSRDRKYSEVVSEIAEELKITERTVKSCLDTSLRFKPEDNLDINNQADEDLIYSKARTNLV